MQILRRIAICLGLLALLLLNVFLVMIIIYRRYLGEEPTYNTVTEITVTLLAFFTSGIYLHKKLYSLQFLLDKKLFRDWKLWIVLITGTMYILYYTILVWCFFDDYYGVGENRTEVEEYLTRIGDRTYIVLFPVCNLFILFNTIIVLIRIADFNSNAEFVAKSLSEFVSGKELKWNLDRGMLAIETRVCELCGFNNVLQYDFSTTILLLVTALFVLVMNTVGLTIMEYQYFDVYIYIHYILQFLYPCMSLVIICEACQDSDEEKRRMESLLSRLCLEATHLEDKTHMFTLTGLRSILADQSFAIVASDLFYVKRKLLVTLLAVSVSYCIIIYQFAYPDGSKTKTEN